MKKLLNKVKVIFHRDMVKMTKVILHDILFYNFGRHTKKLDLHSQMLIHAYAWISCKVSFGLILITCYEKQKHKVNILPNFKFIAPSVAILGEENSVFFIIQVKKLLKLAAFVVFPTYIMVLFEIHQRLKDHFLKELRVSFKHLIH